MDKIPPHSKESESAALGAMLLDSNAIEQSIEIITPDSFWDERNKIIYRNILELYNSGTAIDIVVIAEYLKKSNELEKVGSTRYLIDINQNTPTAVNALYHLRIIQENYMRRQIIYSYSKNLDKAYNNQNDIFELLEQSQKDLFLIAENRYNRSYNLIGNLLPENYERLQKLRNNEFGAGGIHCYLTEIDKITGGFQNGDLIILAGRPSMGKTALALKMIYNITLHGEPAAFFSLEMDRNSLINREISANAKINSHKLRTGQINDYENDLIIKQYNILNNLKLIIDDSPNMTIFEIRAKARRLKREYGVKIIFIDYLQLISTDVKKESREREISYFSQSLKQIAKELEIPVVVLAQLNRKIEDRSDKTPQLGDLRESGSIEQDADVIMFVSRPEFYEISNYKNDNFPTENTAEIVFGKHRNGALGTARLAFIKEFSNFENLELVDYSEF